MAKIYLNIEADTAEEMLNAIKTLAKNETAVTAAPEKPARTRNAKEIAQPAEETSHAPVEDKPAEDKPAEETTPEPVKEKETEPPKITIEEVRTKLADLSKSGKQAEVKALISKFGASKLTDIPAEKYPELLDAAKELEG